MLKYERAVAAATDMLDASPMGQLPLEDVDPQKAEQHRAVGAAMQVAVAICQAGPPVEYMAELLAAVTQVTVERVAASVRAESSAPSLN